MCQLFSSHTHNAHNIKPTFGLSSTFKFCCPLHVLHFNPFFLFYFIFNIYGYILKTDIFLIKLLLNRYFNCHFFVKLSYYSYFFFFLQMLLRKKFITYRIPILVLMDELLLRSILVSKDSTTILNILISFIKAHKTLKYLSNSI